MNLGRARLRPSLSWWPPPRRPKTGLLAALGQELASEIETLVGPGAVTGPAQAVSISHPLAAPTSRGPRAAIILVCCSDRRDDHSP